MRHISRTPFSSRVSWFAMYGLTLVAGLVVSACTSSDGGMSEGIGFREARFTEITALRDWRACRDEALNLDSQARAEASPAQYLASARLLEKCESQIGAEGAKVPADDRMRAYALCAQNYLKGGDVPKARETLDRLVSAFPGADLYYANGSSFIDTMEFLTGMSDPATSGDLGIANINNDLKSEFRRAQYWKRN
jgi:hypothetical protein